MFSPAPLYPAFEIARLAGSLEDSLAELGPNDPFLKIVLDGRTPMEAATALVDGTKLADAACVESWRRAAKRPWPPPTTP